jgi:hypothetical protein
MRSPNLHTIAALLVALGLTACGGKASFGIDGTINRLDYAGLVLANGADTVSPAVAATTFTFPNRVDYGTSYDVKIQTQPQHMTCAVANATGSAGHTASIVVAVTCSINAYTVGGTVKGLSGTGLVLSNGSVPATVSPAPASPVADVPFTFPTSVAFGQSYSIGVQSQPAGQTCTVSPPPNGTMGDAKVDNIEVLCTTP